MPPANTVLLKNIFQLSSKNKYLGGRHKTYVEYKPNCSILLGIEVNI